MRFWGNKQTPAHPELPDTVLSVKLTAATGQAFDYPVSCDMVRVSAGSTAAGFETIFFNPNSTGAVVPTTGFGIATTASSTQQNIAISLGEGRIFQRPRSSTGFSLVSVSSLFACVEFWTKGGTTSST